MIQLNYNMASYYLTNCTFHQCTDSDENCVICVNGKRDSFKFIIDECHFIDCFDLKNGYLIQIDVPIRNYLPKTIVVSNCVFQLDAISKTCRAIYISHSNKDVFLHNNSFTSCITNSICALNLAKLVVSGCLFDHCRTEFGSLIEVNGNSDFIIKNCTFDSTLVAIQSQKINFSIIGNIFTNVSHVNGAKVFELIENKFVDCREGTILDARINNEPIIK